MKKKKKRRLPPPDDDVSTVVASIIDPSIKVRVSKDHRVNLDGVLDENLQSMVAGWGSNGSSSNGEVSNPPPVMVNSIAVVDDGSTTPNSGVDAGKISDPIVVPHENDCEKTQVVSENLIPLPVSLPNLGGVLNSGQSHGVGVPGEIAVSQAGCSGGGAVGKADVSSVGRPKVIGKVKSRVKHVKSKSGDVQKSAVAREPFVFPATGYGGVAIDVSGALNDGRPKVSGKTQSRVETKESRPLNEPHSDVSASNRANPLGHLTNRVDANVHDPVPAGPREAPKVRPKFSEVLKDNRIIGNGFKLEHYELIENEDDVVLDKEDEIPFVETWGYCLIGCFTGPFPGRHALNSLVNSWHVKCQIIPYAKGWTVFRFKSDEDRFRVFNGGPYLAFGKTLMLRLVDAGVILGDDLFTSVPTWVLFHDVPLSVWSESGLSKIASKVGIPMYTDKFTKERTKMSYARCLVDVDVSKPPVLQFGVKLPGGQRYTQKVTYECYPDYCCDCKTFGHNVFKCPKKVNEAVTPVVPSPVVPPPVIPSPVVTSSTPTTTPVPATIPVPVIPTKVNRLKTRFKNRQNAQSKASLPKQGTNIVVGSSSEVNTSIDKVPPLLNKGKGLRGVDKGKAIVSQLAVVSPNSFETLADDISDTPMGDLAPSVLENANHEEGVWQHVTRKGSANGRGGAVSSSVSPCR
ncbi:hypothetical protein LIER_32884 [Lithospermum erythrorhizon]|uniref:DUF4283 domain-containing protein n=1 Tax=Lithospermum erythrorhizon TaxID=34254 RepID=A0AAV3S0E3_LITER